MPFCVPLALVASSLASTVPLAARVEVVLFRVPADFAATAGLTVAPRPGEPEGQARSWVLAPQVAGKLAAALARAPKCVEVGDAAEAAAHECGWHCGFWPILGDKARFWLRAEVGIDRAARRVRLDLRGPIRLDGVATKVAANESVPVGGALVVSRGNLLVVAKVVRLEVATDR